MEQRPVVLITGASRGLGRGLAAGWAQKNYAVIGCSRSPSDLSMKNYRHVKADITDEAQLRELVEMVHRDYGRLDVLINNAGLYAAGYMVMENTDRMKNLLGTNILGAFMTTKGFLPLMMGRRKGQIVNFSSIAVSLAAPGSAVYSSTKAAIEQFTRVLAKEVGPFGIRVHCLSLSGVEGTSMINELNEAARQSITRSAPDGRLLRISDVLAAIETIVDGRCDVDNGQVVKVGF